MIAKALNAEQFIEQRFDLPDAGQWAELHLGEIVLLEPPDEDYGNVVRNLARIFAQYIEQHRLGYACFDLGLKLQHRPDTLLFPAACFYLTDDLFGQSDLAFSDQMPQVVIEIHSTHDRRQQSESRREKYFQAGVQCVCQIDPRDQSLQTWLETGHHRVAGNERWQPAEVLPRFQLTVSDLFELPVWWNK